MRSLLLLWNDLIPICPEVFMPYIDILIEGFKDLKPTVLEDHRCGVVAAKAYVKLVLYLGNTANYSKFYDLMGYVMMTLFMALGEEVLVCSLLEDLIILARAETEFFKVQIDVVIDSMVKVVENLELKERTWQLVIEFVLTVAEDVVSKLLSQLIVMLVHIEDDPNWGNAIGLIFEGCSKVISALISLQETHIELEDPMRSLLLLWNDLIPICPEVFMPYIDILIEGFKDLKPTILEDHRCGVVAAKASVKLVLYLGNTANYSKFYDLMGYVMMTLFMALGEEVLVCSLLEDLIILAGAETEFFKVQIDVVIDSMVKVVENLELKERTWQLAIEFVLIVAEDVVSKLLSQLIVMLVHIEDDPNWGNAISDDENAGELSMCSYAMESLGRLAIALGGNVILPSCLEYLFSFLYDENWRIRHAAVTAIGLISEGCSKALLQEMGQLVETVVMLIHDTYPRVRWASIHSIGQLSKYLSPHFQEHYHQQILPALLEVLDDFDNPRLQIRATSGILLFTRNCSSDVLKPYLQRIVSKLVVFLQVCHLFQVTC
ncbi:uncharacterized protein LOC142166176 isoform X1 [Nicotiana tabacum]|uniref:Uncharacterized protein LOC142166176 isoform X1 n=3 Tax=Nicotiana tabacum TaxID=4097 RepID=A0AC58S733_TOBAC